MSGPTGPSSGGRADSSLAEYSNRSDSSDRPNRPDHSDRSDRPDRRVVRGARLALVAVCLLAAGTRLGPLWWSPLPGTLDGLAYAGLARRTVAAGHVPLAGTRADALASTLFATQAAQITGLRPLVALQPLYGLAGVGVVLVGLALARRLFVGPTWWRWVGGRGAGGSGAEEDTGAFRGRAAVATRRALVLAGVGLAVDGVLVRRTGVPDDDVLTLLTVPLLAYTVARCAGVGEGGLASSTSEAGSERNSRWPWAVIAGLLALALPLTHTFSTMMAGVALVAVLAAVVGERGLDWRGVAAGAGVAGFWAYALGYYEVAPTMSGLVVPYVGRIRAHPGLFVAWLVVLVAGVVLVRGGSGRGSGNSNGPTAGAAGSARWARLAVGVPLALAFAVVGANAALAVFPGTATTPPAVLWPVLALAVPAAGAVVAAPLLAERSPAATTLLALFGAAAVQIGFDLTAALTPEYFATAMRAQTFLHPTVLVLAGAAVGRLAAGDSGSFEAVVPAAGRLGRGVDRARRIVGRAGPALAVALLVAALIATVPLAYVNYDTGTTPATTTPGDFAGATFADARVPGAWASSQPGVAMTTWYRGDASGANASGDGTVRPVRTWLRGGPAPACPVLAWASWATTGAHLFPAAPRSLPAPTFRTWLATNHRVYAGGPATDVSLVVPTDGSAGCDGLAGPIRAS